MRAIAYWLAIGFIFTIPWEAALRFAEFGRGSKALGLVLGVVWLCSALGRGRIRSPSTLHKTYFLFLVWNGLSFFWSIDPTVTRSGFLTYTQLFMMMVIFWDLFRTREAVEVALQAYVLGAFITAGSIISNFVSDPSSRFPAHERFNALGFQTDGVALIVAIAAPAAWYLAVGATTKRRLAVRVLNLAYIPIGLLALVATGTRGATLASIPTVVLILWSLRRSSGLLRVSAAAVVVVTVFAIHEFAPRGPLARIGTVSTAVELGEETSALSGRWSIWAESRRIFMERPITGAGLDTHRSAVSPAIGQRTIYKASEKEAHNIYFSVLAETGIVGFLLFGAVIASLVAHLWRMTGWDAWYWSVQLAVIAIGAMSLSLEDSKSLWMFAVLAVITSVTAARHESDARERTGHPLRLPTGQTSGLRPQHR
jgi:O-antigen ligase